MNARRRILSLIRMEKNAARKTGRVAAAKVRIQTATMVSSHWIQLAAKEMSHIAQVQDALRHLVNNVSLISFLEFKKLTCVYMYDLDRPTQCPSSHPYPFAKGLYCCATAEENVDPTEGDNCDGGPITFESTCCKHHKYLECADPPCKQSKKVIYMYILCIFLCTDFSDSRAHWNVSLLVHVAKVSTRWFGNCD